MHQHRSAKRAQVAWQVVAWLALVSASLAAQAADSVHFSKGSDRNTARLLDLAATTEAVTTDQPAEPVVTLQLGAAYERASSQDNVLSTPYLFSYAPNRWYFEVSGDGYQRARSPAMVSRGLADVAFIVNYLEPLDGKIFSLQPEVELDLPTHGEVGSKAASEVARLSLLGKFNNVHVQVGGGVGSEGTPAPAADHTLRSLFAEVQYNWDALTLASLKVKQIHQTGASSKTAARAELDVWLSRLGMADKHWVGVAILGNDRSAGRNTPSIEFDLAYEFK